MKKLDNLKYFALRTYDRVKHFVQKRYYDLVRDKIPGSQLIKRSGELYDRQKDPVIFFKSGAKLTAWFERFRMFDNTFFAEDANGVEYDFHPREVQVVYVDRRRVESS